MVLLMLLFLLGRLAQRPRNYPTAEGTIEEAKVAIAYSLQGNYGGTIYYRIEAKVRFEQEGQMQERWLSASEADPSREILQAKLSSHPQHCVVYWPPRHPENAHCRLP
jgi:hypothetical protein